MKLTFGTPEGDGRPRGARPRTAKRPPTPRPCTHADKSVRVEVFERNRAVKTFDVCVSCAMNTHNIVVATWGKQASHVRLLNLLEDRDA